LIIFGIIEGPYHIHKMADLGINPITGKLDLISVEDLSGYVPYTGATSDVDLDAFDLTACDITSYCPTNLSQIRLTQISGTQGRIQFTDSGVDIIRMDFNTAPTREVVNLSADFDPQVAGVSDLGGVTTWRNGNFSNIVTANTFDINATIDHSITNSSDKLVITNPNQDKNIAFNINHAGSSFDFLTLDSSTGTSIVPRLILDGSGFQMDTQGVFRVQGSYQVSSVGVGFTFAPTITSGGNFVALFANPIIESSTIVQAFRLSPTFQADQNMTGFILLPQPHVASYNDTVTGMTDNNYSRFYFAFSGNDAATVNFTGLKWGSTATFGDIGFTNVAYTETMIDLTGGLSRVTGSNGSANQKGIKFTSFGTQTGITASDSIYAIYADGGLFAHAYDYNGTTSAMLFGAGEDAGIGYNGTDLVLDAALVGSGGVKINDAYTLPKSDGIAGEIIKTDGSGTTTFVTPTVDIPIVISMYDAEPARSSETQWNGGIEELAMAQTLGTSDNINITNGIGKIVVIINASTDSTGTITVTGDTIDRNTGVVTIADTDTVTISGNSTDNSSTDSNGNIIHSFIDGYITNKWFTGSIVLSTTDVTLTDVDVYHISFEQFNDQTDITLNTFDANIYTTSVNAEFDAYLFTLHKDAGSKFHIDKESELHVGADGETAIANRHFRLRKGNINEPLDGTTDGFWVDAHYSNSPAYVEDVTLKVWATKPQTLTLI